MSEGRVDVATVIGVAVAAGASMLAIHEFCGHGLTALALGQGPIFVTSTFVWPKNLTSVMNDRVVTCAGSAINLVVLGIVAAIFRARPNMSGLSRYVLWALAAVHGFNGFGYMMTSYPLAAGDFHAFAHTFASPLVPGVIVTAIGAWGYLRVMRRFAVKELAPLIGNGEDRFRRARVLALTPYFASIVIAIVSTSISPVPAYSMRLAFMATVFGLFGIPLLARRKLWQDASTLHAPREVPRSLAWIALGPLAAIAFVAVFGPGFQVGATAKPMKQEYLERVHAISAPTSQGSARPSP